MRKIYCKFFRIKNILEFLMIGISLFQMLFCNSYHLDVSVIFESLKSERVTRFVLYLEIYSVLYQAHPSRLLFIRFLRISAIFISCPNMFLRNIFSGLGDFGKALRVEGGEGNQICKEHDYFNGLRKQRHQVSRIEDALQLYNDTNCTAQRSPVQIKGGKKTRRTKI